MTELEEFMETRWAEVIQRLQTMFPESDGPVLAALIEKTDAVARYIAQIHDLTISEAAESIEWVLDQLPAPKPAVLVAE